ncbi:DUF3606 domain-containing protein [Ramlibacter henchirensis]|uniref:DUF3606 domain-containing protein n=1 Tax=Ramlibacter henchirensis TaxID=204072 RepID=A0A4Z0C4C5_9BURK|nr:DUF3606 domain-containing protein [Ramlibacter henchirensis]TFZ06393.1 DUF3606 domain-containing protein [Ramlibacter henchirensis]
MSNRPADQPDRIDLNDKAKCESWARKLNTTHERLREAVGAVGDDPRQVEEHLKKISEKQRDGRGSM